MPLTAHLCTYGRSTAFTVQLIQSSSPSFTWMPAKGRFPTSGMKCSWNEVQLRYGEWSTAALDAHTSQTFAFLWLLRSLLPNTKRCWKMDKLAAIDKKSPICCKGCQRSNIAAITFDPLSTILIRTRIRMGIKIKCKKEGQFLTQPPLLATPTAAGWPV